MARGEESRPSDKVPDSRLSDKGSETAKTAGMLAWKQPSFKKCVTAYQPSSFAPMIIGTQACDRSRGFEGGRLLQAVGERSTQRRRWTERTAGARGSENPGISSEKTGEKPVHRKPKVSWGR